MAMASSSSSSTPQNPSPLQNPNNPAPPTPPLRIRPPSRKPKSFPHSPPWAERKLVGSVDYDEGRRRVSSEVAGVCKDGISSRYRLRVEGSRWQRDWKVSEVAERVLGLDHWEDVDTVLNFWAGRFARRNFPLLIREITNAGSLEHAVHVFCWLKNQKNYCARTDMYNMMIRLHARHNRIDQARGLFFEMQEWRVRDWRTAIQVIEHMEPSFSSTSLGILNQLLHFLGKCGKIETMMKIFFKILASCSNVSCATYSILLKNLLAAGKWRKYIEVLQWMEDAGIQPAAYMYRNVISYAWKENSMEYVALIQEKIKLFGSVGGLIEYQVSNRKRGPNKNFMNTIQFAETGSCIRCILMRLGSLREKIR